MDFDINRFNNYREDNRLEVKSANGGLPRTLWETYSSFANTYGGCIICGVVERKNGTWKTTGLKNIAKLKNDFWNTIHNKRKVSHCLISESDLEEYTVGEDVILVIKIPKAPKDLKPIFINNDVYGGSYRRDFEGDYRCSLREVKAMIRDSFEETMDQRVLRRKIDFDADTIHAYRIRYNIHHDGSAWTQLNDTDFLIKIGALNEEEGSLKQTAAGLLMFGKEETIIREYPYYFLDYREHLILNIRWTDRIYSQEPEWSGNVFDFFTRVSAKLELDLKKPFKLVNQERMDKTPVHDALREALVNCLVNTDFYQPGSVVIEKYPDRIVLANPGTILTGKNQMLKGGITLPRNSSLFKMFNLIGLGEHAGSGVPNIFYAWKEAGLDEPYVEEWMGNDLPDRTILTLPLTEAPNHSYLRQFGYLNGNILQILDAMEDNKKYSVNEISKMTGLKASKARQILKELVDFKQLETVGNTRGKRYFKPGLSN